MLKSKMKKYLFGRGGYCLALLIAVPIVIQGCFKDSDSPAGSEGANGVTIEGGAEMTDQKDFVVVELHSDTLVAFDLPYEGVRYKISNFTPGFYRVPLKAIKKAPRKENQIISVDTGRIFLVDAGYLEKLREIENRIWEETNDSYNFIERYDSVVRELGIKYNYIEAGENPDYDFTGDGSYVLDILLVTRLPENQ